MNATLTAGAPARNLPRSVGAILAAFVVVFVLSLGTDQILHVLNVYPPWGQPMWDHRLNALALSYRLIYGTLGGYVTARLAPHTPMRHALIGGSIGFVLSTLGALGAMSMDLGPAWYPIALALSAIPTSWLGARLYMA